MMLKMIPSPTKKFFISIIYRSSGILKKNLQKPYNHCDSIQKVQGNDRSEIRLRRTTHRQQTPNTCTLRLSYWTCTVGERNFQIPQFGGTVQINCLLKYCSSVLGGIVVVANVQYRCCPLCLSLSSHVDFLCHGPSVIIRLCVVRVTKPQKINT